MSIEIKEPSKSKYDFSKQEERNRFYDDLVEYNKRITAKKELSAKQGKVKSKSPKIYDRMK